MPQERTNRTLDEWRAVAHSARRPLDPPRPGTAPGQLMSVLGTAVVAVAVVAVLALASRAPSTGPASSLSAIASAAASSALASEPVTPPPAATPSPTAAPSATTAPIPTQGPAPAAVTQAEADSAVTAYTQELVAGQYAKAWARLGEASRSGYGSLAAFTSERSAYFASVRGKYRVEVSPPGLAPMGTWLAAVPGGGVGIDPAGSVLVEVTYPLIAASNQFDVYIVARVSGSVAIFIAR